VISAELSRQLKQVSQQQGVTLYMSLLAALASVAEPLYESAGRGGRTDIANRNHLETEGLIGFFVINWYFGRWSSRAAHSWSC